MATPTELTTARIALTDAATALEALQARCCDPGRSPQMEAIEEALGDVRRNLESAMRREEPADRLLTRLEEVGAQIGSLQIGCCAPNRLPLYAEMLEKLTHIQLAVNRSLDRGH